MTTMLPLLATLAFAAPKAVVGSTPTVIAPLLLPTASARTVAAKLGAMIYNPDIDAACVFTRRGWVRITPPAPSPGKTRHVCSRVGTAVIHQRGKPDRKVRRCLKYADVPILSPPPTWDCK